MRQVVLCLIAASLLFVGCAVGKPLLQSFHARDTRVKHNSPGNWEKTATWIQAVCADSSCTQCTNSTQFIGFCEQLSGGSGSVMVQYCNENQVVEHIYTSSDCSGSYTANIMPVEVCLASTNGGQYIENFCPHPTNPSTPAPGITQPPSSGHYTEKICVDDRCTEGCDSFRQDSNVCVPYAGGKSQMFACNYSNNRLMMTSWDNSGTCEGSSEVTSLPLDTCLFQGRAQYASYGCPGIAPSPPVPTFTPKPPMTQSPQVTYTPIPPVTRAPELPPGTATPVSPPSGENYTFTQYTCNTSNCAGAMSGSCHATSFATGTCVKLTGGYSVMVTCGVTTATEQLFSSSSECQGTPDVLKLKLSTCQSSTTPGTYVENICTAWG